MFFQSLRGFSQGSLPPTVLTHPLEANWEPQLIKYLGCSALNWPYVQNKGQAGIENE